MHLDANSVIALAAVAGLLVTAATVAGGAFRVSHHAAALAAYKAVNEALEAEGRVRDSAIKDLQDRERLKDAQIAELQAQMGFLKDLATGRSAVEDLRGPVEELLARLARVEDTVGAIRTRVAPA